ncbi:PAS domain-containing hybrid sensor histidine kinase/response regulator [Desulfovibrio cuneatus]|uniref:PAS domain-containing hybrid sensor histidine kinase/response regulator n=1 Tax=Desulfovibrio cuneatus TaxID=159728 RepID=UPI00041A4F65|nr:PAS domain-containing hybrid sensor histidine kinase/response regulator [Desulfovibrio cuneatus]
MMLSILFAIAACLACWALPRRAIAAQGTPLVPVAHESIMSVPVPMLAVFLETGLVYGVNEAFVQSFGPVAQGAPLDKLEASSGLLPAYLRQCMENGGAQGAAGQCVFLLHACCEDGRMERSVFATLFHTLPGTQGTLGYVYIKEVATAGGESLRRHLEQASAEVGFYRDKEGRFLCCTASFERLSGCTLLQLFGRLPKECNLPPALLAHMETESAAAFAGNLPFLLNLEITDPEQELHVFASQCVPDVDNQGTMRGMLTVWHDITTQHTATLMVQREERLLQAAIDATQYLFADTADMDSIAFRVLQCLGFAAGVDYVDVWRNHPTAEGKTLSTRVYFWAGEEYEGNQLDGFTSTLAYEDAVPELFEALVRGKAVVVDESSTPELREALHSHGLGAALVVPVMQDKEFWGIMRFGVCASRWHWGRGDKAVLRTVGMFLAGTMQRRYMQEALVASEHRYDDVIRAAGEVVWEVNAQGYLEHVSERIASLSGYTPEEFKGTRWEDYALDEQGRNLTGEMFQLGIVQGSFRGMEHQIRSRFGTPIWLLTSGAIYYGREGIAGMRGTSMDITEAKFSAHKLSETLEALGQSNTSLQLALEQAEALAQKAEAANRAKTDFIANMSHEIRTPLNAIIGMAYLLQKSSLDPKQADHIRKINSAGLALLSIINDILDFSKLESGRIVLDKNPYNLESVFEQVALALAEQADTKSLPVFIHIASSTPRNILGDAGRFRQVLANLVGNAVKFTETGFVAVHCGASQITSKTMRLHVTVEDTGIGMTEEQLATLFTPFTQGDTSTTRKFGGTGLGLVIAKNIVSIAGGELTFESTPNKGSVVTLSGPVRLNSEEDVQPVAFAVENQRGFVLVVEPSEVLRSRLVAMLEDLGCVAAGCENMGLAFARIAKADATDAPCSVLLLGESYLDAAPNGNIAHLRENMGLGNCPRVVAMVGPRYVAPAVGPGIHLPDALVPKPVLSSQLFHALRPFMEGAGQGEIISAKSGAYFYGVRVLLVEDNGINQEIGVELLRDVGIEAQVAETGREAVRMLESAEDGYYDMVFMDLQMPDMDGYTATTVLRENPRFTSLPIVAMTAHATTEEQEKCFAVGMNGHIAKPLDIHQLHRTLHAWLDEHNQERQEVDKIPPVGEAAQASSKAGHIVELGNIAQELRRLNALLREDDADACALFQTLEADLRRVNSSAVAEAGRALAVFDFSTALSFLEPMENGLQ